MRFFTKQVIYVESLFYNITKILRGWYLNRNGIHVFQIAIKQYDCLLQFFYVTRVVAPGNHATKGEDYELRVRINTQQINNVYSVYSSICVSNNSRKRHSG
jgi:hypothetical protein